MPLDPWCIPCTKVRISLAWSFKNHNIIYNKSRRAIMNLRRELYSLHRMHPGLEPDCRVLHSMSTVPPRFFKGRKLVHLGPSFFQILHFNLSLKLYFLFFNMYFVTFALNSLIILTGQQFCALAPTFCCPSAPEILSKTAYSTVWPLGMPNEGEMITV